MLGLGHGAIYATDVQEGVSTVLRMWGHYRFYRREKVWIHQLLVGNSGLAELRRKRGDVSKVSNNLGTYFLLEYSF